MFCERAGARCPRNVPLPAALLSGDVPPPVALLSREAPPPAVLLSGDVPPPVALLSGDVPPPVTGGYRLFFFMKSSYSGDRLRR